MNEDIWHQELRAVEARWRRRLKVAVAAMAVLALLPSAVLAVTFGDVTNANPFYVDIGRVSDAAISAGCGSNNYCPKTAVTREQMAAFLARTGSRAGFDRGADVALNGDPNNPTVIATVSIRAGNVTGGTGFVVLMGSATGYVSSATGLPVRVGYSVRESGSGTALGNATSQIDTLDVANGGFGSDSASVVAVVPVPTGVTKTFVLTGWRIGSTAVSALGDLAAVYVPFSEDGDATLNP